MNTKQALETPLPEGHALMAVINAGGTEHWVVPEAKTLAWSHSPGDTRITWNPSNEAEVEAARKQFDFLKNEKRFMAYKTDAEGNRGEVLAKFDPSARRILFAPPMQGGRA